LEADEGHSKELVSTRTDPKFYDDLDGIYRDDEHNTILKLFRSMVASGPDIDFLGTRDESEQGAPYKWMTRQQLKDVTEDLARGIKHLGLA